MESLYTKYRPQTFADVVGQTHVVTTLERAVMEGRTSHAYLFCGPRGTGKTTMARLLAKAMMCEQGAGHLPDGTCEQCRLIAAGEHPDVYELDAASRTGVDNVREEIISRVSFAPVRAPYKMYIIDEVHMLTTAAFNALLKTLEEPPAHVIFVLCTTDPQKIPETILSRVQRFDFHPIGSADIQQRLAYICEREGFGFDPEALDLVVRHARGGMRDAISELEQLSVSGGGQISVDVARDVLGEVSASTLEHMSLAMANRDVPTLFAQVESLVEVGRDLLQFTRALAGRLRDVYVVAAIGAASGSVQASDDELPAISREAKAFGSVDRVARALELLSDASTEMRVAPNQRLVLEVALTKIARPQTELTLEALADRVATLERQVVALSEQAARKPASAPAAASTPVERQVNSAAVAASAPESAWHEHEEEPAPRPQRAVQKPVETPPTQTVEAVAPERKPAPQATRQPRQAEQAPASRAVPQQQTARAAQVQAAPVSQPKPETQPAPAAKPAATAPGLDQGELQRRWKKVVDTLLSSHPQHGSLLMSSTTVMDDGYNLLVSLPNGSGFACRMLERADVRANLDPVVNGIFGARKVRFAEESAAATISASMANELQQKAAAQPESRPEPEPKPQPKPQYQSQRQPTAQQPQPQRAAQRDRTAPQQRQASPQFAPRQQTQSAAPVQTAPQWQAPVRQQAPAQQQAPVRQQAPAPQQAYPAPWEPQDDDVVPYDDMDMSPYEEEYAFDPYAQVAAPSPRQQFTPAQNAAYVAQAQTAPQPAPEQQPEPEPQRYVERVVQSAPVVEAPPAREPQAMAQPMPEPEPEPEPQPEPVSQVASAPAAEAPAPKKTATKRASRTTGGVPNDILNMMTAIFGEGITYTSEPSVEEQVDVIDDDVTAGDDFSDATSDGGEFLEEPVDDADYDEE